MEGEVILENPSLYIRSPINPAIMPNQSEEEKSSSVSAGILAKVVSHLLTVDLRKEDDDAGKDLGIIPEIQAPTDPAIVPKQSEEIITSQQPMWSPTCRLV